MMGICATSFEAPTIKGTAGVLFFTEEEDRHVEPLTHAFKTAKLMFQAKAAKEKAAAEAKAAKEAQK